MPGVASSSIEGAHTFPRINLPKKFIKEAESLGRHPDLHFCLKLVDDTGITTVPGSGFGEEEGTSHFRMTNMIYDDQLMDESLKRMSTMVNQLHHRYS